MRAKPAASAAPASGEGCPMRAKKKAEPAACVSSAEDIDPSNMMPPANQEQSQYQSGDLSKERVESTIPRGANAEGNWVYPSEQMFFNALHRKGKGEGVQEEAMPAVIAIHNNMNENTRRCTARIARCRACSALWAGRTTARLRRTSRAFWGTGSPLTVTTGPWTGAGGTCAT